ncbi:MAG TPA: asparagine synthase (glutamine-hydrolyzing) [bacterium]|nr:asparagine synthase (glutamine-hydrolyzing) [bacterium]
MCGICGEYRRDGGPVNEETIRAMTRMLMHRGPDDEGFYRTDPPFLRLGQRRLSIIDLPGGRQPMANEDGTIWVVFNGEIYNFMELREDLIARGHEFKTLSDTETIIHQYEEDGPDCVNKFNGMFAFAVWDGKRRRLFLARDRLGIKPLYYAEEGPRFIFASELGPVLRALGARPSLDRASLWAFLTIQYAPSPRTMFRGVRELGPGRRLIVDRSGVKEDCYWRLPEGGAPLAGREAEEGIRELLDDAVRLRLIADVPLGAFLSGGIDSTALVAAMRRHKGAGLKTFSVDFRAELGAGCVNETRWAELAARRYETEHHRLTVTARDALDALPAVVARLDDLISDPAVIPTYLVSRFARESVTVCLSGEGGDELFAGYQRYALGSLARFYRPIPALARRLLFELPASRLPRMRRVRKALAALGAGTPVKRHLAWLPVIPPEAADELLGPESGGREMVEEAFAWAFEGQTDAFDLDRTLRADLGTWLPDDLLTKVDRASMAAGLECRVPYLDYRLVELALRIPAREKAGLWRRKVIFKKAVAPMVPAEIIKRKKYGFALPLDAWFRRELKEMMLDLLHEDRLRRQGVFQPGPVQELIREHLSGREDQGHQLFSLLLFQLWQDSMNGRAV